MRQSSMSHAMHKRKQILIISPEPWEGHFVSKHHYAVTLASQGYKVYFLNPPQNALKSIQVKKTNHDNLWSVDAPQVAKGLRFYPKFLRSFVEKRWLESLEKKVGHPFSTVWLFENSRFYNMAFAGERTKIYHQVDLNQNFHVKEASGSVDICFATTDDIIHGMKPYAKRVFKIHHGVTLQTEKFDVSEKQKKNFSLKTINVVLVGNLDIAFLDVNVLVSLVQKFPQITFHFVGSYSENGTLFKACTAFENIIWWGRVESSFIPTILSYCDVNLLIYKAENNFDKEQLASPHKMMEYLASGKVTVASYTDEYKDKRNLLEMVDSSEEYIQKFEEVIHNLDLYNAKEKQQERIDFAQNHSYEKQLEKIVVYLKEYNITL